MSQIRVQEEEGSTFGALESLLSVLRARKALSLLPRTGGEGRILDVGCGLRSTLLKRSSFAQQYGVDRRVARSDDATVVAFDLESGSPLPFKDRSFDVVTMLAALEHVDTEHIDFVLSEIRRVLKTGGCFVLTTPAGWTQGLLTFMSKVRLVSPREIDEHKYQYAADELRSLLAHAGFADNAVSVGTFQFGANLWARGYRTDDAAPGTGS